MYIIHIHVGRQQYHSQCTSMSLGSNRPLLLLEELARHEEGSHHGNLSEEHEEIATEITHQFSHWLLRFPTQCVLTAEAIMWERAVFKSLERNDKDDLKFQR